MRPQWICGAYHFNLPEQGQPEEGGFEQRARTAGISDRDLLRFACDAYPELEPAAALRAYRADVARAASRPPNDAMADYSPIRSR